jgi:hypothetical protein
VSQFQVTPIRGIKNLTSVSDFYPSRIQQQHQKRRGKLFVLPFFAAKNIIKLNNFFAKIIILFTQKFVQKLSGSGIRDPGFENI